MKPEPARDLLNRRRTGCRDTRTPGQGHWYRITGLSGWERANLGLPAWGGQHVSRQPSPVPGKDLQKQTSSSNLMKIAIPVENGRLNQHFGGSRQFALLEVDSGTHTIRKSETLTAPEHQPGVFPRWLREQGVQVVIVGGIGQRALTIFAGHGIEVLAGTPNATPEALVLAYLSGHSMVPPSACAHHHHSHDHHHHSHDHGCHNSGDH